MLIISASPETVPARGAAEIRQPRKRSVTMKKLAALLSIVGFAATPFANASEDGLELMPNRVEGVEITHFVRDAGSPAETGDDAFYARGTGGISPQ
jgi:hypothetical protein